jgi:hypothetical protein
MGCCGQKRSQPAMPATGRAASAPAMQRRTGAVAGASSGGGAGAARGVILRYRDRVRVRVRGPVTGQSYEFSAEQPTRWVDARDADTLLRTRHFMRA